MKWSWEFAWISFGLCVAVLVISSVVATVTAEKNVKAYYLGAPSGSFTGTCVMALVEWAEDHVVFCSQDINQTLDVLVKANASLGANMQGIYREGK